MSAEWKQAVSNLVKAAQYDYPGAASTLLGALLKSPATQMSEALGLLKDQPGVLGAAIISVTGTDLSALSPIVAAFPKLAHDAAVNPTSTRLLVAAMQSGPPPVRDAAETALLTALGPDNLKSLKTVLTASPDEKIMTIALCAEKVRTGTPTALPVIQIGILDDNPSVRRQAIEWLGATANVNAVALKEVRVMAMDPDPNVRAAALYGLSIGMARTPEVLQLLLTGLKDTEPSVRINAVAGLSAAAIRHNNQATGALVTATRDPDTDVRKAALQALCAASQSNNQTARSVVGAFTSNSDAELAAIAKKATERKSR